MPSRKHQSLAQLLLEHPSLLVELVRRNLGVHLPDDLELVRGPETVRSSASDRIADGAIVLRSRGSARETFVLEVQMRRDAAKRKAWAIYVVGTWAQLGCPATLVVVTVSDSVARWAAEPVDIGRGRMVLHPVVIGPTQIPTELTLEEARARPERLALSVITHGHRTGSLRLGRVALIVARELIATGRSRSIVLADLITSFVNERVRRIVEAEMNINGKEVWLSDWGKEYGKMRAKAIAEGRTAGLAEGRSEGRAAGLSEGRAEGLAKALSTVLEGRGLRPTHAQRERIDRCRSTKQLEKWLARALSADTVTEVLRR